MTRVLPARVSFHFVCFGFIARILDFYRALHERELASVTQSRREQIAVKIIDGLDLSRVSRFERNPAGRREDVDDIQR